MKRTDIPSDALPYVDHLDGAEAYLYYTREWFFEGANGTDGRTVVIMFTRFRGDVCHRFAAMHFWMDNKRSMPVRQVSFFDEDISCVMFNLSLRRLVRHGILDIPNQEINYSTAHASDIIGIKTGLDQENWYSLIGISHHTDPRHEKYILPFFMGKLALGPYIKLINQHQI